MFNMAFNEKWYVTSYPSLYCSFVVTELEIYVCKIMFGDNIVAERIFLENIRAEALGGNGDIMRNIIIWECIYIYIN